VRRRKDGYRRLAVAAQQVGGIAVNRTALVADIRALIDDTLETEGRGQALNEDSALLGALPEFDSMAVVSLITALENQYGFSVDDDEIGGETFETLGSLVDFVERKLMQASA